MPATVGVVSVAGLGLVWGFLCLLLVPLLGQELLFRAGCSREVVFMASPGQLPTVTAVLGAISDSFNESRCVCAR